MSSQKKRSISLHHQLRKWEKVIQPIVKYSRHSSSLGYQLDFIFELECLLSKGHTLKLNLPTTLSGTKDNCLRTVFASDSEEVGTVIYQPGMIKSQFDNEIEREMNERIGKLCERDNRVAEILNELRGDNLLELTIPYVLVKEKTYGDKGEIELVTQQCSREDYKKIANIEVNQVAQSFIFSNSKSASITRFFLFPGRRNSIAFKIDNCEACLCRHPSRGAWRVREGKEQSFIFVKIMHTNKSFYKQAVQLVKVLESALNVKVSKLVTDWIIDANNRYFLVDVREALYEKKQQVMQCAGDLGDRLSFISCSVCQQKFHQDEITKIFTSKMVWEFFEHLKKRQIVLSFKSTYRHSSNNVKACNLCYSLVVAQIKLMEHQRLLAKATHSCISMAGSLQLEDKRESSFQKYRGKYPPQLYEWRLFFYFQDIRGLELKNVEDAANYYAMVCIHNSITSFRLKDPKMTHQMIKGVKIHYIFSETDKIEKFITQTEIIVRITNQNNWNAVLAEGNTSGLYEENEKHSMRKFKQILLFDQSSKYCVAGLHIGIKLEGKYSSEKLILTKCLDAYMLKNEHYNSYALPAEWMETIDQAYCEEKPDQYPPFVLPKKPIKSSSKVKLPNLIHRSPSKKLML